MGRSAAPYTRDACEGKRHAVTVQVGEGEGTTVTTETVIPPAPETVDTPDVTVVNVDIPESDASDSVDGAVIDHEGRLVRIETAVTEIATAVAINAQATQNAAETADVALEVALEPEPEPEPEPDKPPNKPHVMHRTWRELWGKNS